ncbi:MAG TPA: carboxymuconolactone decarboxylase family protein [Pseudonocardiaceae bacterium]|nr:carboxymuconolactone decarboxylase family protein [Pseudonocardiaceae bacterium]
MGARITNPALLVPAVMHSLHSLSKATEGLGVPSTTIGLIQLRASQINGCSVCVDMHSRDMKKAGETDERLWAVAAWRDSSYFTEPERAALALAESLTRIADQPDAVPDDIWAAAAKHYDESGLAGLVVAISAINVWNRFNVASRQIVGEWTG